MLHAARHFVRNEEHMMARHCGLRYEGEWDKGVMSGRGRFYFKNGDLFEGRFEAGSAHGLGKLNRTSHGAVFIGEWCRGERIRPSSLLKIDRYRGELIVHGSVANKRLTCRSWNNSIKTWNVDTGECMQTFTGHTSYVITLQLLANNSKLASGSPDKTIRIWNVDTGECIRTLVGHTESVVSLQSIASDKLASGSGDT